MTAEDAARAVVRGRNNHRSQFSGSADATDYAHRYAAGRGGPVTWSNGLWLTRREHEASHAAPDLSRAAGWMVDTGLDPAAVPALCICQGIPGWWVLEETARLADPAEVRAAGLDPALTLTAALTQLHAARVSAA